MAEQTQTEQLNAVIDLGGAVVAFLSGPVGIYLSKRAEEVERDALEALATVDSYDSRAVRALQNDVWKANTFMGWCQEAIEAAVQAHQEQQNEERLP